MAKGKGKIQSGHKSDSILIQRIDEKISPNAISACLESSKTEPMNTSHPRESKKNTSNTTLWLHSIMGRIMAETELIEFAGWKCRYIHTEIIFMEIFCLCNE